VGKGPVFSFFLVKTYIPGGWGFTFTSKSIIYEADRQDEFAPINGADGVDCPATSAATTTARNAAWLEKADRTLDCVIEIAPSFALYAADVAAKKGRVAEIHPGDRVYLE